MTSHPSVSVPCGQGVLAIIEPPAGWITSPPTQPACLCILDPAAPGPFSPNINLVVLDLDTRTPEEFLALSRRQLKAMGDNIVLQRDQPLGRAGDLHLFEFLGLAPPYPVRCVQQVLFHGGRAYVLTALAALDEFEAYRARFEQAFASFTLRIGT